MSNRKSKAVASEKAKPGSLRRLVGRLKDELYDEKFAHRQTESARNKLANKYLLLCDALDQIKTLPRGGRAKRIAASTLHFVDTQ